MKVIFVGTPAFAVSCLEILKDIDFLEIKAVVTHPDKPKGRHLVVTPPPVKLSAQKYNLPLYQPERVSSSLFIQELKKIECDLIIIVSFGEILSKDVLNIPKLGCINVHSSLLPKYRGAAPVSWALLNGETKTGVTTFWLTEKMDRGDVILQKEVQILKDDNKGSLEEKLSHTGAELLKETVIKIHDGSALRIPQDERQATYTKKINKNDGLIDWKQTAENIHNKIRAMNPWPGAYTFIEGVRVEIWESEVSSENGKENAGTVVLMDERGIGISTGQGILIAKELQAEGKKKIKAKDFVHGYRINEGQIFG